MWNWSRPLREQDRWKARAALIDALATDRFLLVGGPIGTVHSEGPLHVVNAPSADSVRARLEADPWVGMGLLRVGAIEPWTILRGKLG